MTEVISTRRWLPASIAIVVLCAPSFAQKEQIPSPTTNIRIQSQNEPGKKAEDLYLQLRSVGLDPQRIFRIREASLDRDQLHISLDDGIIGFTQDVNGHVTGAFFEGDGEILLFPPGESERASMMLFTRAAILEQDFSTAYFRFNDSTFSDLRPYLRATPDAQDFMAKWNGAAKNLAEGDALRLFLTFSRELPVSGTESAAASTDVQPPDRLLHGRVQSEKLGVFDIYYDTLAAEQIAVAQPKAVNDAGYYNVWTSFSPPRAQEVPDEISIRSYQIQAEVTPPTTLKAQTRMKIEVLRGGSRALLFELSRNLKVSVAKADGQPLELIQNQALAGTALARRGNDLLAVVFPRPLVRGQKIELELSYAGDVLSEAGGGLLYVGARGIWYPNRGPSGADFDLEFQYPSDWTLLATGKRVAESAPPDATASSPTPLTQKSSHWVTETPIPLAGFNLGRYVSAIATSAGVPVETYAARSMEKAFPRIQEQVVQVPSVSPLGPRQPSTTVVAELPPSPARNAQLVADTASRAVRFFAERFGPYPYQHLEITQMPGFQSQGWPGLIFLSSYAFLSPDERARMHIDPTTMMLDQQVTAHETAHQWWGDLVYWRSYRDQWISEALANYSSFMLLESENPSAFHAVLNKYREALLAKSKDGRELREAGPVTLGVRLSSSEFPDGYDAISYGRGTWLFHMLRHMLDDGQPAQSANNGGDNTSSPFIRVLRELRERHAGRPMTTRQMLDAFATALPQSVRYEGKKSLDWFFEGWVNGTAVPRFELQGIKINSKGTTAVVTGTILQKDAPKELVTSVPLYAVLSAQRRVFIGRVFADGPESSFRLMAPVGSRRVELDPYRTLLRAD